MITYYNYHFYNGVFKKQKKEIEERIVKFKKFNCITGGAHSDVNLMTEDDDLAILLFVERQEKRIEEANKKLQKANIELNILMNVKNNTSSIKEN